MRKLSILLFLILLSANIFAGKTIQIKGSDTMVKLGKELSDNFMKITPGAKIEVDGSVLAEGVIAIFENGADIVQSTIPIDRKEVEEAKKREFNIKEWIICYDGIAIVTANNNPVKNLTTEQLRAIYLGEIKNWKELNGFNKNIILLSRDESSSTTLYFKEKILKKGNNDGKEEFSSEILFLPSTQSIIDEVAKNDAAIGFFSSAFVENKIKTLKIDGKEATAENIKNKVYPIVRQLYWYTKGEEKGDIKNLIYYLYSEEGQAIVKKEGYVPLN